MFGKGFFVIVSVVSVGLLAVACTGNGGGEPVTTAMASPVAEKPIPTPEPTATSSPVPTATPEQTATPEPTPELPSANPVPGSCLVFEEKYCDNGVHVNQLQLGVEIPANAAIFAPFDGWFIIVPTPPGDKNNILKVQQEEMEFLIQGDLKPVINANGPVSKGQLIGFTTDTGLVLYEKYRVMVHFAKYYPEGPTGGKYIPDADLLHQFFTKYERYVPDTERRPRPYQ
jgi:hypothetical protein